MDHLSWIVFNVIFALLNWFLAGRSYRQGKRYWYLLQMVCAILCALAAAIQLGLWLRS